MEHTHHVETQTNDLDELNNSSEVVLTWFEILHIKGDQEHIYMKSQLKYTSKPKIFGCMLTYFVIDSYFSWVLPDQCLNTIPALVIKIFSFLDIWPLKNHHHYYQNTKVNQAAP